jgi:hypothetical protein
MKVLPPSAEMARHVTLWISFFTGPLEVNES